MAGSTGRGSESFRGGGNQPFADMMVDLHASVALIGGPLALLVAGAAFQDGLMVLPALVAGVAAAIWAGLAALMLLARRFQGLRKWAGLAFGLPIFLGLSLVCAGIAAAYYVQPAAAEFAHLKIVVPKSVSARRLELYLGFLERHAGTPEAAEMADLAVNDVFAGELPLRTKALVGLYRKAPEKQGPLLAALWKSASTSKPLAEALRAEGLPLEAER